MDRWVRCCRRRNPPVSGALSQPQLKHHGQYRQQYLAQSLKRQPLWKPNHRVAALASEGGGTCRPAAGACVGAHAGAAVMACKAQKPVYAPHYKHDTYTLSAGRTAGVHSPRMHIAAVSQRRLSSAAQECMPRKEGRREHCCCSASR